jgi:hypothetical protein
MIAAIYAPSSRSGGYAWDLTGDFSEPNRRRREMTPDSRVPESFHFLSCSLHNARQAYQLRHHMSRRASDRR